MSSIETRGPPPGRRRKLPATSARAASSERAQLIVIAGQNVGQTYPVAEARVVIGRGEDADVVLDDDEVSRQHATIERERGAAFVIADLGSRNGTSVNGKPVERCALEFGDKIQLSSTVLLQFVRFEPLDEQLRRRQRLEMLGRLSAGLAHDLKNMLAVLLPNLDYLRKLSHTEPLDRAEMAECIEDIEYAANQGAELMPRFGTIARSSDEGAVQVDVSTICDQVVQLARRTFSRAVEVSAAIDPELCVNGNSADLFQILMNLCLNARDAMPDGGKLELSAKTCEESGSGRAGNRIRMTVRDSGEGMDEATLARAFEPFFTTKARAQGFGVGLATVRDLVGQLGGEIRARSELGVGTTFEVDLPLVPAKAALRRDTADGRVTSPPPSAEDALVLLVDDEPAVRRVMRKQLELRGYTVIEAEDGQHALEVHASCSPQPDVVVLDLDMPRLPGHEVVRELKRASPQVQVLIHTAIPKSEAAHDALHYGALQCLSKPCDPQALLTAISRALRR